MKRLSAALLLYTLASAPAAATWSIILIDTTTGEIAIGSATCLANFDLRAGTPVLIPGIGAATAQSFVDSTGQNRVFIRDRLIEGVAPADILTQLASFDGGHQTRQYGITDTLGRTATFSGTGAGAWAGGQTGQFNYTYLGRQGTIAYAIQGNVLTGSPVVTAAVQAVIDTEGDVAARLMAGMEAARAMGGDGRCSCTTGTPTACGSPPPTFTKSAHIAYMLIARAGDIEGSNGIYRAAAGAVNLAIADVTGPGNLPDGRPDIITSNANANSFSVQANTTASPGNFPALPPLFPTFGSYPTNYAAGSSPRAIAIADMNADGRSDCLSVAANSNAVLISPGLPAGGFGAGIPHTVGLSPRALALGDFDSANGPDFATANGSANTISVRLNDGAGGFTSIPDISVEAGPLDIVAGDFVGSAALDLAVLCRTAGRVVILQGDGAGSFATGPTLTTATNPAAVTTGDFDADGRLDLALVCDTTRTLQVYRNQNGAFTPTTTIFTTEFSILSDLVAGDIDGDGDLDLIIAGSNRFGVMRNDGAGGFALERIYTLVNAATGLALGDLDSDGDLDLAIASSAGSSFIVKNYGPGPRHGTFNDGLGCATGEYFMNFNIAFQSTAAPDPVLQLQSLFDQWRTSLSGHADAVQSLATFSTSSIPANSAATSTLTITLRDWQGQAITTPVSEVLISHAPGSAGSSTIGPVTPQGNGISTVQLTAGAIPGIDRFRITAVGSQSSVILMPDPALTLTPVPGACYPNCDNSTQAPILNIADFGCFLAKFAAGDPYANCDGSTLPPHLNIADFGCFLAKFAAGCT